MPASRVGCAWVPLIFIAVSIFVTALPQPALVTAFVFCPDGEMLSSPLPPNAAEDAGWSRRYICTDAEGTRELKMLEVLSAALLIYFFGAVLFVLLVSRMGTRGAPLPKRGTETMADVERLVRQNKKIHAIKVYREIHGVGLAEAKEIIEKMIEDLR